MQQILVCNPFYPSFIADLLIALIGAILGIGAAYMIYLISVRQIRIDRLRYVVSLIESFILSAKRQAEFCIQHSQAITVHPFDNLELKLEANRDIKRLSDKMDQEGVFHAYLWKYKRQDRSYEEFKNLYGFIDYLDFLIDDMISTNVRIMEFMWQRKKQYQISFKKLKELVQALSLDDEVKKERAEFVNFSIKTLKTFLDKEVEKENLVESFKSVVEPMRNFIVEKVNPHLKVTEIFLQLDDLQTSYFSIELQVKHNANDYKNYADALNEKGNELKTASERLRTDFSVRAN